MHNTDLLKIVLYNLYNNKQENQGSYERFKSERCTNGVLCYGSILIWGCFILNAGFCNAIQVEFTSTPT